MNFYALADAEISFVGAGRICQNLANSNTVYRVSPQGLLLPLKWLCSRTFARLYSYSYTESTKEDCPMRKRKLKIYFTPAENSIVIQSLNHLRNAMLRENRDTGFVDELLLKVMCAPVKKI